MADEFVIWHRKLTLGNAVSSLEKNGFKSAWVETGAEAVQKILGLIPPGAVVGIPGSSTLKEINILEALKKRGNKILHHGEPGLSEQEKRAIQRSAMTADVFLSGSNAITLDGKIVNIDGVGNRVSALSFGPQKTIVVAGINKIVENTDDALNRIKNIAAPINAKRYGLDTPCVKTGYCTDCDSPQRICNIINIISKKPKASDFHVILVNQELGY